MQTTMKTDANRRQSSVSWSGILCIPLAVFIFYNYYYYKFPDYPSSNKYFSRSSRYDLASRKVLIGSIPEEAIDELLE